MKARRASRRAGRGWRSRQSIRSATAASRTGSCRAAGRPSARPAPLLLAREQAHHQPQALEQVGVARALNVLGQSAQALRRVVVDVARRGAVSSASRIEQQVAVLGHEQEQQPVDQAQQLAVVVLLVERAAVQPVAQGRVGRVRQEARARARVIACFDAVAQLVERARALLLGGLASTFPASSRSGARPRRATGGRAATAARSRL